MRFNPHAFKRLTEPHPVSATDANASSVPTSVPGVSDLNATLAAFICAYGHPGANQIPVPEGSMAVTLSLKYNDSAPQVDHFEYHAPTGCPAFLVLLVKKQAQTENLARKALTACPELHSLDWQWKSEKYGGGHGNYLQSSYFPTPPALKEHITARKTFGIGGPDAVSWEIQFANAWRGSSLQLWPHKHYGAPVVESPFSNGRDSGRDAVTSPIVAAWYLNERMRGVEIHFTRRPDDATLAPLRGDRAWRYTGKTKCWYARQTPETIAWAKTFCENFNGAAGPRPGSSSLSRHHRNRLLPLRSLSSFPARSANSSATLPPWKRKWLARRHCQADGCLPMIQKPNCKARMTPRPSARCCNASMRTARAAQNFTKPTRPTPALAPPASIWSPPL